MGQLHILCHPEAVSVGRISLSFTIPACPLSPLKWPSFSFSTHYKLQEHTGLLFVAFSLISDGLSL